MLNKIYIRYSIYLENKFHIFLILKILSLGFFFIKKKLWA